MGALIKVVIKAVEGGAGSCTAMFNPKELSLEKTVSWTPKDSHQEDPTMEYKEPQSSKLGCTLYFDTYEQKSDCYGLIKPLEAMAKMDKALGHPPLCLFIWGKFQFKGVVASLSQKYTMFLEDGTRVRCEVGLQMQSAFAAVVSTDKH